MTAKSDLLAHDEKCMARADALHALQREEQEAPQRGIREQEALLEYERAIGAGARPEPDREAELVAAWQTAREGMEARPEQVPHGGGVFDLVQRWVDPRVEARVKGAKQALEDAQTERREFIRANVERLALEDAEEAHVLATEANQAVATLRALAQRIEGKNRWWTGVAVAGDLDYLVPSIPRNGLAFLAEAPTTVPWPMPEVFVP